MSFTVVKKANGLSVIVNNTVLDASGDPHVVSNNVLDADAVDHTLFGATVELTPLTIIQFDLYDNRIFEL
jgi:hypothetical protein